MSQFQYLCEWNPTKRRESKTSEAHANAFYIVNITKDLNIKLCRHCIQLKKFRVLKRVQITEED